MEYEKDCAEKIRRNADALKIAIYGDEVRKAMVEGLESAAKAVGFVASRLDGLTARMVNADKKTNKLARDIERVKFFTWVICTICAVAICLQSITIYRTNVKVAQLQEQVTQETIIEEQEEEPQ